MVKAIHKTKIIAITGGSGSGKTALAFALRDALGHENAHVLSEDDYYKDVANMAEFKSGTIDFDNPIIRDHELLYSHLLGYLEGDALIHPVYDFVNHKRSGKTDTKDHRPFLIIEGTHILINQTLRELFALNIFVETKEEVRFARRLKRDIEERGRTKESVREMFDKYVTPAHDKWTEPSKFHAQIIIENHDNAGFECAIAKILGHLDIMNKNL